MCRPRASTTPTRRDRIRYGRGARRRTIWPCAVTSTRYWSHGCRARHIRAQTVGARTDIKVPLEFVRVQPYVSPKIELSNQRQEKVDLRVLPVIFRFRKQDVPTVYPGQAGRCLYRPAIKHALRCAGLTRALASPCCGGCALGPDFHRPRGDRRRTAHTCRAAACRDRRGGRTGAAFHARRRGSADWWRLFKSAAAGCVRRAGARQQSDARGLRGQLAPEPGQPARRLRRVLSADRCRGGRRPGAQRAGLAGFAGVGDGLQSDYR